MCALYLFVILIYTDDFELLVNKSSNSSTWSTNVPNIFGYNIMYLNLKILFYDY